MSQLCQSCGFCCDGSLFHRARLLPEEVEPAKKKGLRVFQDVGFEQPCPKLENRACTIYDERPTVCRKFACKLLVRHRDEGGPIEARLRVVARMRNAIEQLDKYGYERTPEGEVRFSAEGSDAFDAMNVFAEVMQLMEHDFARDKSGDTPPKP